jgi:hypothetical protein
MQTTTDGSAGMAAGDFANRIVPLWHAELGPELLGAYLLGSLAHGGFTRRYSDIDVAVITEAGLSEPALDHIRGTATALSAEWGARLSVFWADRGFTRGRFPPLDRVDYLDHGVTLMEREKVRPKRPSLDEIRHYLARADGSGAPACRSASIARTVSRSESAASRSIRASCRPLSPRATRASNSSHRRRISASFVVNS